MRIRVVDVERGEVKEIDQSPEWLSHGPLENFVLRWSADSRWLSWARPVESGNPAIFLYDTKAGAKHQATSGYFSDANPVFDPEGRHLFYLSDRNFEPVYSDFDNSWSYPNATRIVAVPLRADVKSPLAPKNDVEGGDEKKPDEKKDDREEGAAKTEAGRVEWRRRHSRPEEGRGEGRAAGARRDRPAGLRGARRGAAAEGRQLPRAVRREGQGRCIVACRAPARATTRAPSSTSTSRSARRRPSSTTWTGSSPPPTARSCW